MAVVVAGTHGHDGQPGTESGQQVRILKPRPVMRDLEHIDAARGQETPHSSLRRRFDIAGEEEADPVALGVDHDAGVVRHRSLRGNRSARPEDLPPERADRPLLSSTRSGDPQARLRRPSAHAQRLAEGLVERAHLDLTGLPAPQETGEADDMVCVEVREQHQRQPPDAERAKALVDDPRIRTGIDDHRGGAAGIEHQGVALPHVARHEDPAVGGPFWSYPSRRRGQQHNCGDRTCEQGAAGDDDR